MSKRILTTPIKDADLESLHIGDIIYLNDYPITGRDDMHQSVIKKNKELPVDLAGLAVFHAGPIMQKIEGTEDKYRVISIGPTTSMRMEKYEKDFIPRTGVKIIVGKGGMGADTAQACKEHKAIHTVFPGGCAVLAANCVEEVERVEWLDLGMPEAMWVMRVKEFGPLIVSIDTQGNNLFENNKKQFNIRKDLMVVDICQYVDYLG